MSQLQPGRASRRSTVMLSVAAVSAVVIPFLAWRQTWFGQRLGPEDIGTYLSDNEHPRKVQHALEQIADRILRGDSAASHWYPRVAALSRHPLAPIRATATWTMGQDNGSELFHDKLRELLQDPEVMVRRNAALALVRFRDASGRPELVAMLGPYRYQAPRTGRVSTQLDEDQAWEALRALYLVGRPEDLPDIERLARGEEEVSDAVRKQAALTAQAIRARSERTSIR